MQFRLNYSQNMGVPGCCMNFVFKAVIRLTDGVIVLLGTHLILGVCIMPDNFSISTHEEPYRVTVKRKRRRKTKRSVYVWVGWILGALAAYYIYFVLLGSPTIEIQRGEQGIKRIIIESIERK